MANKIINGILRRVFKTSVIKIHYLQQVIDINSVKEKLNGFDISIVKELTYDDFLHGDTNHFTPSKLKVIKNRLSDESYQAFGILEDGYLIYSTWISYHLLGLPEEGSPIYLNDDEGYLEDSYCDPKARGRGLHSCMNNYRILKIYESGRRKVIATVLDGNTPSLKTQAKSGLIDCGVFYCGRLFGKSFNTLNKDKYDSR